MGKKKKKIPRLLGAKLEILQTHLTFAFLKNEYGKQRNVKSLVTLPMTCLPRTTGAYLETFFFVYSLIFPRLLRAFFLALVLSRMQN